MNSHRESTAAIAIYPGSFDPITLGHLDIIERASRLFDRIIVVVSRNPDKAPLFSVEQRIVQICQCTQHLPQVEVDSFTGLTVDCARQRGASVLIRGLRALSDFEKELQMAHTNKSLWSGIETMFLATATEHSFLSSSAVKEIAKFGGKIDHLTPPNVALDLYNIYQCHVKTPPLPNSTPAPSNSPLSPTTASTSNENSTKSND